MTWTNEQLRAMEVTDGNMLVSAGAGSGKTAVLIQRIMKIITEESKPVDVDKLLVLTYTNAAAGEMRQRLSKSLADNLALNPENNHLRRQLVLVQRAKIMTLHSFCKDLIKEHGYGIKIDSKSRIANTGELDILRENVLDDVFEVAYSMDESPLKLLLKHYGRGVGDDNIKALVLRLVEFGTSMPNQDVWLDSLADFYTDGDGKPWLDYLFDCLLVELASVLVTSESIYGITLDKSNGLNKYAETLERESNALKVLLGLLKDGDMEGFAALLKDFEFARMPSISKKDEFDVAAKERVTAGRDSVKSAIRDMQNLYSKISGDDLVEQLRMLAPLTSALVLLAKMYSKAWQKAKKGRKLLEFSDLEHYALELLNNEDLPVKDQLKSYFFEVLVDEYQDINQVQESILAAISRDDNRFMVGDIKQSIYRFRLAEPSLFLEKFHNYGQGVGGERVDLKKNFRSEGNILAGVNFVFAQLMQGGNLEIEYDESAALITGNTSYIPQSNELIIIDKNEVSSGDNSENNDVDGFDSLQTAELEAYAIIEKVKKHLEEGRSLSEMVILLRAVRAWSPVIQRVFEENGLNCTADGSDGFSRQAEIQCVHNLLHIIDNPLQDIQLLAVLHSPIVGISMDKLAEIRLLHKYSLFEAVKLSDDISVKAFVTNLERWRLISKQKTMAEFVEYIYEETCMLELYSLLPNGDIRCENLLQYKKIAAEFDKSDSFSLWKFLKFADGMMLRETGKIPVKVGDSIQIMSIHKSKGLEFPIVFVAGLGTKFNEQDLRQDILLHRHMGIGLRCVDLEKRIKYPTLGYNVIAKKVRWETWAENLRVLYVAMTRAVEKLYMVGTVSDVEKFVLAHSQAVDLQNLYIPETMIEKDRTFLGWLVMALLRHRSATKLRGYLEAYDNEFPDEIFNDVSDWKFEIVKSLNITAGKDGESSLIVESGWQKILDGEDFDGEKDDKISDALAWQYEKSYEGKIPVKWSATKLSNQSEVINLHNKVELMRGVDDVNATVDDDLVDYAQDFLTPLKVNDNTIDAVYKPTVNVHKNSQLALLADAKVSTNVNTDNSNDGKVFSPKLTPEKLAWYGEYGTLVHYLLEMVDLEKTAGSELKDQLQALLDQYVLENKLQDGVAEAVNIEKVGSFFKSDIGNRLVTAHKNDSVILREQNYVLTLGFDEIRDLSPQSFEKFVADGLNVKKSAGEKLFFQGVIDLAFLEEDKWILVDYKSGKNAGKTDDDVIAQYGVQLDLYEIALEKSTKKKVAEKYIYYASNGRLVKMP